MRISDWSSDVCSSDLGLDVARKLVILAREAGRDLSLDDVEVENLVPESLRGIDRELFITRLAELDAPMRARLDAANIRNLDLRYLARMARDGKAHVGLVALPADDACLHTRLPHNLVQFHSRRTADTPPLAPAPEPK